MINCSEMCMSDFVQHNFNIVAIDETSAGLIASLFADEAQVIK